MVHAVESKEDFDKQLEEAGDKLVVVDFFATWCGPCKQIAPILDKMSETMKDSVVFLKVDVDELEDVAAENNITCMPTFLLFKKKSKVAEFSGANAEKLTELIESHK